MRRLLGVAVAAAFALGMGLASTTSAQPVFDHLKCYKVKELNKQKVKGLVDLTPSQTQFLRESDCKITGPKLLCVPVSKENVRTVPPPPGAPSGPGETDHICYSLSCRKTSPGPATATDRCRPSALRPAGTSFRCTPARTGASTTTTRPTVTTTTTSTTTTMPATPCRSVAAPGDAPMCGGDCPATAPKC